MRTNLSKLFAKHLEYNELLEKAELIRTDSSICIKDSKFTFVTHLHYPCPNYSVWQPSNYKSEYVLLEITPEGNINITKRAGYDQETIDEMRTILHNFLNT